MRSRSALTVITLLALAGCSNTAQTAPPSTTVIVSATTKPIVTSAPIPSSASSASTTPTTIAATTTSTLPITEQVRAAAKQAYVYYWKCLRKPAECDPTVIDVSASDAFNALTKTAHDLAAGGFFVGDEDPGYMVIESIEAKADHTLVTSCWWSTAVLYGPPPNPGESPVVQNDTHGSGRQADQFVQLPDGTWKIRRGDDLGKQTGVNECPPAA